MCRTIRYIAAAIKAALESMKYPERLKRYARAKAAADTNNSVFAVIPPVTALLENNTKSRRVVAFPELGMEAFYEMEVVDYPAIIAAVHGKTIY